ncbi:c-type cytochrome [Chryseobacterium taklimakanense]|uniref:Diheme cytochrome c-553 n=1 Tax=Chryseobacterium taklimakanense TaxID=536441 RepID=A0A3G8WHT7_9FLAO|nr:c-type cytochrome [Chryseobacterium taklimakanense]AZI20109.1 diheme cytochrome c-553 [Chryseobacterium taklimakanense]
MKAISISAAFLAIFLISCQKTSAPDPDQKPFVKKDSAELVQYGKYLVTITGCNDCHTPKKMGPKGPELIEELLLSGFQGKNAIPEFDKQRTQKGFAQMSPDMTAAAGPWGISFAANLTPDETGIGNWTFDQFKTAMTQGKYKGMENGRLLLPPMPWFNFTEMKDEDLQAIFAYLKSIKPVENVVPAPKQFEK